VEEDDGEDEDVREEHAETLPPLKHSCVENEAAPLWPMPLLSPK
jgi:hypothetical protein